MRSFRRFGTRWLVSAICIATLTATLVGTLMVATVASAQSTMEVSVVDFRNTSKIPNEMFGTMATDAVVVELLRSGKFTVTTADALQGKMEELGYKAKEDRVPKVIMTPAMMVRLGGEVGAESVITGEITSIKVDGSKKAEARISLRMLDVASGVWANGAIAVGASNPRIGYTADKETDLIIEAINNAARQAVESMVEYIIPEATIIGTFGSDEVLLNKGAQDGMQPGMEMIVLRRGETGADEVVGRLRISKTSDTDAHASVIKSTRGLKPEDRVRAVFELPKDTGEGSSTSQRPDGQKRITKGNNLLWGLVALVGVAALFKSDKSEQLPAAIAMVGRSPDVNSSFEDGGILIAWNDVKPLRTADIIQYHVWRDSMGNFGPVGGNATNVGPVMANDRVTAPAKTIPEVGTYDHAVVDDMVPTTFDYAYSDPNHALAKGSQKSLGMTPSEPHDYYVSCLYARQTTGADGKTAATYWETSPVHAGLATFVSRPIPEIPGGVGMTDPVELSEITFQWRGSAGADQYIVEVSPSPYFIRSETWVDVFYRSTGQDGVLITKQYTNVLKNADTGQIVPELANVPPGGTLYWRVGARNRSDSPGPVPAKPTPQSSGPKNTRYIYSDPMTNFSFTTLGDIPGPPPDTGGSDTGGDGSGNPPPPPPL